MKMTFSIVNAGDASSASIEKLSESFNTLAVYVRQGLQDHGYQFVLGRFLSSTHTELKEFDACSAFHAPTIKTIFFAEFYKCKDDPEEHPIENFTGDLTHEAGHFVDLHLAGTGKYPDGCSSTREGFRAAFEQDAQRLAQGGYNKIREVVESSEYSEDVDGMLRHFMALFIEAANSKLEV